MAKQQKQNSEKLPSISSNDLFYEKMTSGGLKDTDSKKIQFSISKGAKSQSIRSGDRFKTGGRDDRDYDDEEKHRNSRGRDRQNRSNYENKKNGNDSRTFDRLSDRKESTNRPSNRDRDHRERGEQRRTHDRSHNIDRTREPERDRDRNRKRDNDGDRERERVRDWDRDRDRDRGRDTDKRKREVNREHDKDRSRGRNHDKDRDHRSRGDYGEPLPDKDKDRVRDNGLRTIKRGDSQGVNDSLDLYSSPPPDSPLSTSAKKWVKIPSKNHPGRSSGANSEYGSNSTGKSQRNKKGRHSDRTDPDRKRKEREPFGENESDEARLGSKRHIRSSEDSRNPPRRKESKDDSRSVDVESGSNISVAPVPISAPPPPLPPQPKVRYESIYERVLQVGEGTYGKVYKTTNRDTGLIVALKRLRMESEREGMPITAIREIKLLQSLRHENIVSLQEMMVEEGGIYMVFEYMDHDIAGILSYPDLNLSQGNIKFLFRQMMDGLSYLHHQSIVHRDIKGSNILLDSRGNVKIADFGLARKIDLSNSLAHYTNRVITLWYRPPELLLGATIYSTGIDIWGMGCLLIELFNKSAIFQGKDEISQLAAIYDIMGTPTKESWPRAHELPWFHILYDGIIKPNVFRSTFQKLELTEATFDLAERLLGVDPGTRISAHDALEHEYFKEEPVPEQLDLSEIGEWHDFEAKKRRREKRREKERDKDTKRSSRDKSISAPPPPAPAAKSEEVWKTEVVDHTPVSVPVSAPSTDTSKLATRLPTESPRQ
ncbi:cyclin-dependent serine/threonine protein kinase CTK1 [Sugiyamaella lignohabitans]|uniref:Cyclin-dependent serine/threonine protein kinase CTK1 n=1 Tax=Sugiyamaella lignohabitans TaxID=796027 RepID=A0A170QXZ1_9ASCO|nr:cyclin-dependent serine/threonine protein kinase CTK1 [Sugiyamaella lignohabitans]ANB15958.1 cyclin-dependent serine/threonine protein kinase CTK1 [Sugiyamaella lignohabitans]